MLAPMTAQVHDVVRWRSQDYLLVGVAGDGLFNPLDHGLVTRPTTTANWRGWVAHYAIEDDLLVLAELTDVGLFLEPEQAPPSLGRVEAVPDERGYQYTYPALNRPISFTGRLIFARGFIQSLYRHMGFHPAWKFEESWEFVFSEGRVTWSRELTAEMQTLRQQIEAGEKEDPDSDSRPNWIARTFGLDLRRSKGD